MSGFMKISDLNIGSIDAVNYTGRQDKQFLSEVFLRDSTLEKVLERKRYFLVGEKGTGKTAYATLLTNMEYKGTASSIRSLSATDYSRFIKQKALGHLQISSYVDIWKVILLQLVAGHLEATEGNALLASNKFQGLRNAIESYQDHAFAPEVLNAIEFAENAEAHLKIIAKYLEIGGKESSSLKVTGAGFQTNLLDIERKFMEAIGSLKLAKDHIVFIDGIDVRPSDINFDTYIECIKGLAFAAWSLNLDYFSNIRDSKGRVKVVTLLRPDIFDKIGFHNSNAKIRDNSVMLDWKTTYGDFATSRIFRLADNLFGKQTGQPKDLSTGEAWHHYFNYKIVNRRIAERLDDPFVSFLRYSFYRPRDVISYITILKDYITEHRPAADSFNEDDFEKCQQAYSDYLLGEVKDYLSFYHSEADFDELTGFFRFLKGKSRFSWRAFVDAYREHGMSVGGRSLTIKELQTTPEDFLQFLYSMNVIGYDELTADQLRNFVHWCFRDRSPIVLNPKIPANHGAANERPYSVHPGLVRALKLGQGSTP